MNNDKTLKAHSPLSVYSILPVSQNKKKKKFITKPVNAKFMSNIKIQIHKITIETK